MMTKEQQIVLRQLQDEIVLACNGYIGDIITQDKLDALSHELTAAMHGIIEKIYGPGAIFMSGSKIKEIYGIKCQDLTTEQADTILKSLVDDRLYPVRISTKIMGVDLDSAIAILDIEML